MYGLSNDRWVRGQGLVTPMTKMPWHVSMQVLDFFLGSSVYFRTMVGACIPSGVILYSNGLYDYRVPKRFIVPQKFGT